MQVSVAVRPLEKVVGMAMEPTPLQKHSLGGCTASMPCRTAPPFLKFNKRLLTRL